MRDKKGLLVSALILLGSAPLVAGTAFSADRGAADGSARAQSEQSDRGEIVTDAQEQVAEATRIVNQMKRDPKLVTLMQQARGVFVAPNFGKGAAIVGARGGEGVLLVRRGEKWSSPAFYDFGSITIGPQVGGAAGSFAMLLMDERALRQFTDNENSFSLDANAGLTIAEYSAAGQGNAGAGDIVVWSDTEGLFAGVSIAASNISRDEDQNRAYYRQQVTTQQLLSGSVTNPDARALQEALPDRVATRE